MKAALAAQQRGDGEPVDAWRLQLAGRVQGVGFRPFVYRLALQHRILGWVCNRGGQVEVHAQGSRRDLGDFWSALKQDLPPGALIARISKATTQSEQLSGFLILPSLQSSAPDIYPPADVATCSDCMAELHDANAQRFRYPFINCAHCGPRYSVLHGMPYDRRNTTMAVFDMCTDCRAQYDDPADRRHHAQPLACARCGPALWWQQDGLRIDGNEASLAAALDALHQGLTIALRGIGGYHLLCDASSNAAVMRLREAKQRPRKPFAVLVPMRGTDGLDFVRRVAELSAAEGCALLTPERPIVVLRRRSRVLADAVVDAVSPALEQVGVMLPYSALLHLILDGFQGALVATSGNLAGESMVTAPVEAESMLDQVAAGFLHHDRHIARAADDSVFRAIAGRARPLRLGRGSSPTEMMLAQAVPRPMLALGALQKNTIALAFGERVAISPHLGDFTSIGGRDLLFATIRDLELLYGVEAEEIICDAHPAMAAMRLGRYAKLPLRRIFHHVAHASAVAGECAATRPMLCFTWDANGVGQDGSLWGGEALLGGPGTWSRVASFRPFPLLGGELAARYPWRSALGLCWQAGAHWPKASLYGNQLLRSAFEARLNCPMTSAVGRLFDAAAALLGVCSNASFSGEAAMRLEGACLAPGMLTTAVRMPLTKDAAGVLRADWQPLLAVLLDPAQTAAARAEIFHASLAQTLLDQALAIRSQNKVSLVGLGGGVFQNRILTELVVKSLRHEGFEVVLPERLPVNDASISYGQIIEASAVPMRSEMIAPGDAPVGGV